MRRTRQDRYDYPPPQEPAPLGPRIGRFFVLMAVLFTIAAAVIVAQRLSHDSLALLIGLACGVMAMLPTLLLGLLVWRREDARRQELAQQPQPAPYPTQPPVIVVAPQALPGYGSQNALPNTSGPWQWASAESQRTFKIVGGED